MGEGFFGGRRFIDDAHRRKLVRHFIVEELQIGKIRLPAKFSEMVADLIFQDFRTAKLARKTSPENCRRNELLRIASPEQDFRPPQDVQAWLLRELRCLDSTLLG